MPEPNWGGYSGEAGTKNANYYFATVLLKIDKKFMVSHCNLL